MTAKKSAATTAKTVAKKAVKAVPEEKVYIQFAGRETEAGAITDTVKNMWKEGGHRVSSIKSLEIYVKPEESAAYYVINGKETGRVDL